MVLYLRLLSSQQCRCTVSAPTGGASNSLRLAAQAEMMKAGLHHVLWLTEGPGTAVHIVQHVCLVGMFAVTLVSAGRSTEQDVLGRRHRGGASSGPSSRDDAHDSRKQRSSRLLRLHTQKLLLRVSSALVIMTLTTCSSHYSVTHYKSLLRYRLSATNFSSQISCTGQKPTEAEANPLPQAPSALASLSVAELCRNEQ